MFNAHNIPGFTNAQRQYESRTPYDDEDEYGYTVDVITDDHKDNVDSSLSYSEAVELFNQEIIAITEELTALKKSGKDLPIIEIEINDGDEQVDRWQSDFKLESLYDEY